MVGERHVHGKPSGIDPAVCAYGGVILFRSGTKPRRLLLDQPVSLILSYSGKNRETKGLIGKVTRFRDAYPGLFSILSAGISELSLDAADRIRRGDLKGLGSLLAVNHSALIALGVSNRTLDGMVDLLASLGSYGAKLTGAGGGGSVLAVAPEAKEKRIISGLTARGFETFKVSVPAEGVKSWLER
jgi:mevalonate kinase